MTRWLWLIPMIAAVTQSAGAQASFPCRFKDYRIATSNTARFLCGAQVSSDLDRAVDIVEVDGDGVEVPGTSQPAHLRTSNGEKQWVEVTLDSGTFKSKANYRLVTRAQYDVGGQPVAFDQEKFDFDTKPEAAVVVPFGTSTEFRAGGRLRFGLLSKIAFDQNTLAKGVLQEDLPLPVPRGLDHKAKDAQGNDLKATFVQFEETVPSSDQIGEALTWVAEPGPKSLNSHVSVKGIFNILGDEVTIPDKVRLKLPGAPKDKDSSDFYARFLSQAGKGKPGWAADVKFAPAVANLGSGYFLSPRVLADVGWGKVEDTKSTNMIKAGLGVTKFYSVKWAAMPGMQFTPQMSFETDRKGHHQNLLFDGDGQFFGKNWLNSINSKNERIFAAAAAKAVASGKKLPDPDSLPQATCGWQLQAFFGAEIGGQISADNVKSSDEATNVTIPTYTIARLRPKIAAVLEYKRLSVNLALTPRVLLVTENVTRERMIPDPKDASKQIADVYLRHAKGLRAYGEAGVSWQFDLEGHYALSAVYKLGSLPPNFDYVSTVQSGVTFRF